jgi:hypothetical protein
MRDLRRTDGVSGWHRSKRTYKRKRSGESCSVSSRTAERYFKRGEGGVTEQSAIGADRGRRQTKAGRKRRKDRRVKAMRWISSFVKNPYIIV